MTPSNNLPTTPLSTRSNRRVFKFHVKSLTLCYILIPKLRKCYIPALLLQSFPPSEVVRKRRILIVFNCLFLAHCPHRCRYVCCRYFFNVGITYCFCLLGCACLFIFPTYYNFSKWLRGVWRDTPSGEDEPRCITALLTFAARMLQMMLMMMRTSWNELPFSVLQVLPICTSLTTVHTHTARRRQLAARLDEVMHFGTLRYRVQGDNQNFPIVSNNFQVFGPIA